MKEEFILKLIEEFEKGETVVLQIKKNDFELLLKKEGAFPKKEGGLVYAAPSAIAPAMQAAPSVQTVSAGAVSGMTGASGMPSASGASASSGATGSTEANQASGNEAGKAASESDKGFVEIKSPIVGTFYRAPSPDSPAYVEKGTRVKKGQPLCVLEAMKMMNTLECEYDGVIEEILVANGDLVEFDQPIFKIKTE